MNEISTPGPVKWIPYTWMDPSETYLIASCANTVVKGTLMESERGCCLIQMFRYPSNTHFTMEDLDASLKFVINMAMSSVFDIPGKYVFLIDLGDNLQTPHCQLMYCIMLPCNCGKGTGCWLYGWIQLTG